MTDSKPIKLTVALAVFNEESNIEACLESVKSIADEIVVVDGGSSDKTVEIAKSFKAKVIITDNPPVFHINKQKSLEASSGEWILQLDADERVSVELAQEIRKIVESTERELENHDVDSSRYEMLKKHMDLLIAREGAIGTDDGPISAFVMPRKNYFLGRYLMHGGVYPDGTIRLVRRSKARYGMKDVHDQMIIDGQVSFLSHDLIHLADPTFERYLARSNRYTTLQAKQWFENVGRHDTSGLLGSNAEAPGINFISLLHYAVIVPKLTFLSLYIRHRGFRDGFPGFVWALYSALHIASSYVKYWELRKK
ncbi:MAG: glycosyltransferase family 2 protein [bacterium]|nr:glycosyltransferase family 2 protein [bacterium]